MRAREDARPTDSQPLATEPIAYDTLEGSDSLIQASVPQSPPHRSDVLVDGRERAEDSAWDRGDLLHGLNLHSNVKPVDLLAVGCGFARGSRLRISAPSEITVTSPKPRCPSRSRA